MTTYADKLKDPKWQKKRLKILERDNWACRECGATHKTLHVHHESYKGNPWDIEDHKLKTLCFECHDEEHSENKTVKDFNTIRQLKDPISITGEQLLGIPHGEYGIETKKNPYSISANIRWYYEHLIMCKRISLSEFNTRYRNPSITKKEFIELAKDNLNKECVKDNILLKTDDGYFGYISLVLYQNKVFPLSIIITIHKTHELEVMSEQQYRNIYKQSKMNKDECIEDLLKGVNNTLKVLGVGFIYCNRQYGI